MKYLMRTKLEKLNQEVDSLKQLNSSSIPEAEKDLKRYQDYVVSAQKEMDRAEQKLKDLKIERDRVVKVLSEQTTVLSEGVEGWVEISAPFVRDALFSLPIVQLGVTRRVLKFLKINGVVYIVDLVQKDEDELLKIPGYKWSGRNEIHEALRRLQLEIGMVTKGWSRPQVPDHKPV